MSEFFPNVPKVEYKGADSRDPFAFKFYNPDEEVGGKSMREHLKFAMSYWHTLTNEASDPFGSGTIDRSYGQSDEISCAKARADAAFEFMDKLNIDYFCFHDADIAPEGNSLAEFKDNLAEMTEYILNLMQRYNKKNLWGTANCFTNPRYMHGAGTSCSADVFAYAAAQIKNAIDATIKLGGTGYVFWGGREGYETLLNSNTKLELDNMATLMKMSVEYARKKGFKGDFYIEPKPKEPMKHQYDFDVSTALAFIQKYGLLDDFKMNIEANHATLAGHTFEHEIRIARINGVFGSIDANQGDTMLGWDTDQFPTDVKSCALAMLEILKAGGFTNGGLNFDAKVRRPSFTFDDIAHGYISGMDTFALGLKIAQKIIDDGTIDNFVADRYASFNDGIGAKIVSGTTNLEELELHALSLKDIKLQSARQEYLENIVNSIMFSL